MICRVHRVTNSQTWQSDFHFHFGGLVWLMGKTPCVRARGKYIWEFSSVAQSCSTLCDLMDCSTSGFPVHHQLPELAQTHVHWVGDAILPSHPLLSPSPAFNLSQHQGLFQWVSSSHWGQSMRVSASASILPMNIQDWFPLRLTVIYIYIYVYTYTYIYLYGKEYLYLLFTFAVGLKLLKIEVCSALCPWAHRLWKRVRLMLAQAHLRLASSPPPLFSFINQPKSFLVHLTLIMKFMFLNIAAHAALLDSDS